MTFQSLTEFEGNFLTEKQVADLLHQSVRTIQKWRLTGNGPVYYKFGQSVRYDLEDVQAWIKQRCVRHTSDTVRLDAYR